MHTESNTIRRDEIVAQTEFVIFKQSKIHGTGGFAAKDIPSGTRIIEYVGERITKAESLARCEAGNEYVFDINEQFDLDGSVDWNPARFINHSCAPNCETDIQDDRVWVEATRDIRAGEELTYNYCFDLEEYKEYPCQCGAPECVGYIVSEDYFDQVRSQVQLESERNNG